MFTLPLEWQRENTILLRHAQQGFAAIPINFATKKKIFSCLSALVAMKVLSECSRSLVLYRSIEDSATGSFNQLF
jgi:hypothetical protein